VTAALPMALVVRPNASGEFAWLFLPAFEFVSYLSAMPYLTVRRPDPTCAKQFGIWLLAPVSSALNLYIGWWLRYVGLFTCLKAGWSTRGQVEVGLSPPSALAVLRGRGGRVWSRGGAGSRRIAGR
jgi:hyaluronan synthase